MCSEALHYFMYNIGIDCFATGNSGLLGYIGYITKELCLEGNTAGFNQNMYHMQLHNIGYHACQTHIFPIPAINSLPRKLIYSYIIHP